MVLIIYKTIPERTSQHALFQYPFILSIKRNTFQTRGDLRLTDSVIKQVWSIAFTDIKGTSSWGRSFS